MASRFADINSVEQFIKDQENENTRKKTQQNVALLEEFLTLRNESRLIEEIAPKELNAYIAEFIITVRKKDGNEDYEPSSLRSLMASFERYLKKNRIYLKFLNVFRPQFIQLVRPQIINKASKRCRSLPVLLFMVVNSTSLSTALINHRPWPHLKLRLSPQ